MEPDFILKIILFACNWCSYGGADLAGVGRMQYRPSVRGALFEVYRAIQEL
jgi:coenzyme F420-reducing hydrogenase delta subunit